MTDGGEPVRRAAVHPLMHVAALAAFALVMTTLTLVMIPLAGTTPPWWDWFEAHSLTLFAVQVAVCLLAGILGMVLDAPRKANQPPPAAPAAVNAASVDNATAPDAATVSAATADATAANATTGATLHQPAPSAPSANQ